MIVDNAIIIELKSVTALNPVHKAQVINYLKAAKLKTGLLINFGNPKVEVRRLNVV